MDHDTATVSPSLLHLHFDQAVDGQYVLDPEADVFVKVNPAMCELLGFTREQLVEARRPVSTLSLVHEDDRDLVTAHRGSTQSPGDTGIMRFRAVRSDGSVRHLEVRYTLVEYMGRLVQVGSARDVSEQVKLEQKLRNESDFNRELSQAAQRNAQDAHRKSMEVLEANTRIHALTEVLNAIPVLTKDLVQLGSLDEVYKQAALTMVNEAQFSACSVMLKDDEGVRIAYASPFREKEERVNVNEHPGLKVILEGRAPIYVDKDGKHVAPILVSGEIHGLLEVSLPKNVQRFFHSHKTIQQSIGDLVTTIADFLGIVTANLHNLEQIRRQSREDALTGLGNRRHFDRALAEEFTRAQRYDRDLSLMIMDIDHFGRFNNTYGHQQGDEVLETIGALLKSSFREIDTVCRYGGEELVVIMPETVGQAAKTKAEQIRRKVEETPFERVDQKGAGPLSVTMSIGIACLNKSIQSEEELLREADKALYHCKESGRNQVKLADD
jgi:diguanylate cyclase (GGDEF)-like protein/PAS domain S-box-containing protein